MYRCDKVGANELIFVQLTTLTLKEVEVEEEEASEALAVTGRGPAEADPFDVLALEQVEGRNRKFDLPLLNLILPVKFFVFRSRVRNGYVRVGSSSLTWKHAAAAGAVYGWYSYSSRSYYRNNYYRSGFGKLTLVIPLLQNITKF